MAPDSTQNAVQPPEFFQFDFWLGEWDLTWEDGGQGKNRITRILDGNVILEEFDGAPSMDFRGMSVSAYNPKLGIWQQTWVDSQGTYLDFRGGFRDGRMILSRDAVIDGRPVQQRMVWYNISDGALDWNWERSEDGGQTWQVLWHIQYRRRKA